MALRRPCLLTRNVLTRCHTCIQKRYRYAAIIAKRKVKLSSLYDVDFGDTGVLGDSCVLVFVRTACPDSSRAAYDKLSAITSLRHEHAMTSFRHEHARVVSP
jgi:hypothetical protein